DAGSTGAAPDRFDAAAGGLVCRRCSWGRGQRLRPATVAAIRQIFQVGLARLRVTKPSARDLVGHGSVMDGWVDRHLEGENRNRAFLQSLGSLGGEGLPPPPGGRAALRGSEGARSTGRIVGGDEA